MDIDTKSIQCLVYRTGSCLTTTSLVRRADKLIHQKFLRIQRPNLNRCPELSLLEMDPSPPGWLRRSGQSPKTRSEAKISQKLFRRQFHLIRILHKNWEELRGPKGFVCLCLPPQLSGIIFAGPIKMKILGSAHLYQNFIGPGVRHHDFANSTSSLGNKCFLNFFLQ